MDPLEVISVVIREEIRQLEWLANHPTFVESYKDSISENSISIDIKLKSGSSVHGGDTKIAL